MSGLHGQVQGIERRMSWCRGHVLVQTAGGAEKFAS